MKLCLNDFFWVAAGFAFFASHGIAEDEVPKNKIVHATLNHDDLAVVKVGTTGVTSLSFPTKLKRSMGMVFPRLQQPETRSNSPTQREPTILVFVH